MEQGIAMPYSEDESSKSSNESKVPRPVSVCPECHRATHKTVGKCPFCGAALPGEPRSRDSFRVANTDEHTFLPAKKEEGVASDISVQGCMPLLTGLVVGPMVGALLGILTHLVGLARMMEIYSATSAAKFGIFLGFKYLEAGS